jgi:hypothetical protein
VANASGGLLLHSRCWHWNLSDQQEKRVNKAKLFAGISLIGMGVTVYSLGYGKYVGDVGSGTVTIYPAAALAMVGGLALWSEIRRLIGV